MGMNDREFYSMIIGMILIFAYHFAFMYFYLLKQNKYFISSAVATDVLIVFCLGIFIISRERKHEE